MLGYEYERRVPKKGTRGYQNCATGRPATPGEPSLAYLSEQLILGNRLHDDKEIFFFWQKDNKSQLTTQTGLAVIVSL